MSASGKSSNRHSEYSRARSGGGGHGIYAAQGRRDYERARSRRTSARVAAPPLTSAAPAPAPVPAPATPAERPVESSTLGLLLFGAAIGLVIDRVLHR